MENKQEQRETLKVTCKTDVKGKICLYIWRKIKFENQNKNIFLKKDRNKKRWTWKD